MCGNDDISIFMLTLTTILLLQDEASKINTVFDPITGLAISLSRAIQIGLVNDEKTLYYNPALDRRFSIDVAKKRGWINPTPEQLKSPETLATAPGEDEPTTDVTSSSGKSRAKINWTTGVIQDSRTGKAISTTEALHRGLIDETTAELVSRLIDTHSQGGRQRESRVLGREMSQMETVDDNSGSDTVTFTIQTTHVVNPPVKSITVEEQVTTHTDDVDGEAGIFSFDSAVKLGLYDVRSGQFRDPLTGDVIGLSEAVERGFIDENAAAIMDLRTGYTQSLKQSIEIGLIDARSGKLNANKVKEVGLHLDPLFTSRVVKQSPVNFEDAILSGLFDVETCKLNCFFF